MKIVNKAKRVLINSIGVMHVELCTRDYAAKFNQISTQDTCFIHRL